MSSLRPSSFFAIFIFFVCTVSFLSCSSASSNPEILKAQPSILQASFDVVELNFDKYDPNVISYSESVLQYLSGSGSETSRQTIREIQIAGSGCSPDWEKLSSLIEGIDPSQSSFEIMRWSSIVDIPPNLLKSLETYHPNVKLYLEVDNYREDFWPSNSTLCSPSLYSLKADINYNSEENLHNMAYVFNLISSCPNIRELDLSLIWHGCEASGATPFSFDFTSVPGARIAPLKALRLRGYNFGDGGMGWARTGPQYEIVSFLPWPLYLLPYRFQDAIGELFSTGSSDITHSPDRQQGDRHLPINHTRSNIEAWREAMDWSQLQKLDISSYESDIFENLRAAYPGNLTSIAFSQSPASEVISFLENTPRSLHEIVLEDVEVLNSTAFVETLTTHHQQLKRLSLHERATIGENPGWSTNASETTVSYGSRLFLTPAELLKIRDSLPQIQNISIDVKKNVTETMDVLAALTTFPQLKDLTLKYQSRAAEREVELRRFESQLYDNSTTFVTKSWVERQCKAFKNMSGQSLERFNVIASWVENEYDMLWDGQKETILADYTCLMDGEKFGCTGWSEYDPEEV